MKDEAHKAMSTAKTNAAFEAARSAMPDEQRRADLIAQVRKIHYDAYIRKGFTPHQALFLCTETGLT